MGRIGGGLGGWVLGSDLGAQGQGQVREGGGGMGSGRRARGGCVGRGQGTGGPGAVFCKTHCVFAKILQKFCKKIAKILHEVLHLGGEGVQQGCENFAFGNGGSSTFWELGGGSSRVANILDSQASSNVGRHNSSVFLL